MKIDYSKKFIKQLKKSPVKIRVAFRNRLKLFINDKRSLMLNNHLLKGKFKGFRSINVTGDWRAIFKEISKGRTIRFYLLGTHSQLYG